MSYIYIPNFNSFKLENTSINNLNIKNFEFIFKKHYKELCYFALKFTKNEEEAEEVVQDVFYKIWEKRKFINIKISVKSYLYMSVRNKCIQNINHNKLIKLYESQIQENENNECELPDDFIIYNESIKIFNEALNTLPENCVEIFKMSRFEGLKYKEIAERLAISIKTVEANISKALKTFRIYFPEYT